MSGLMVILIALPGAGKSTRALELIAKAEVEGKTGAIHSTDSFFMKDGMYVFDPRRLGEFHSRNQHEAEKSLASGVDLVVIDNTNLARDFRKVYENFAIKYGYKVEHQVIGGFSDADCEVYAARNSHNVPLESIKKMARRYQAP